MTYGSFQYEFLSLFAPVWYHFHDHNLGNYRSFSHDVTMAILVTDRNNRLTAMLVLHQKIYKRPPFFFNRCTNGALIQEVSKSIAQKYKRYVFEI